LFYYVKCRLLGYFLLFEPLGELFGSEGDFFDINRKTAHNLSSDYEQIKNLPFPNTQESHFVAEITTFL